LNEVFAQHNANIGTQHNQAEGQITLLVLDTDGVRTDADDLISDIRRLSGTIRARVLNQSS
jgi:D-3-phosphoglycerate dehydrogenase